MRLFGTQEKTPVATVEIGLAEGQHASVDLWLQEADRQESGYHAVLHFLMYYARLLFFLSYRETAEELVGWMDEAIQQLATAAEGEAVHVARGWELHAPDGEPRATWSSQLTKVGPTDYRCSETRPADPEDADAQAVALCHLQKLVDTLPALERAYLTIAISGMHEYYREVKIWGNSKSLRPAVSYGMSRARDVLERR